MKILFIQAGLFLIFLNCYSQKNKIGVTYPTDDKIIYGICFTNSGDALAIADNNSVKVYSTSTNKEIREFKDGHTDQILSIDISKDSSLLVSGGKDSTVIIRDLKNGNILKSLKYNGIITSVAISPGNHYIASGCSDNNVYLYDLENKKESFVFTDHTDDVTAVAFTPDGKYLASSGGDKLIFMYSVTSGKLLSTLTGHEDWVRDIAFSDDGTELISCGDDSRVIIWKIWDINDIRIVNNLKYGNNWILSVTFNQDNNTYAYSDFNGNVSIVTGFGSYKTQLKCPVTKILFKPKNGIYLKIAVATRGKGVLLIDANNMKSTIF